jgi:hypothetical protein
MSRNRSILSTSVELISGKSPDMPAHSAGEEDAVRVTLRPYSPRSCHTLEDVEVLVDDAVAVRLGDIGVDN